MTAEQLLKQLSDKSVRLWEDEGKLHFHAPKGAISNEIREELSNQKYEIISLLRHPKFELTSNLPQIEPDLKNRNQPFPLSDIQSAYLIGRGKEFELGNIACHAYCELECSDLDMDRLSLALNRLIKRHETLRLVFIEDGTQKILKDVPEYQIDVFDLRGYKEKDVENHRTKIREDLSHKIHNAGKWPLFDIGAIILDNAVFLYVSFDLLIADFFSAFIMFRDLVKLYDDPDLFLEPIDFSFRDYVLAEQKLRGSALFLKSREYWLNRANSFPSAPQLPFIKAPSTIEKPEFIRRESCLDENAWNKLKDRGSKAQLTPSVVLMTAYAEVLSKWSRNSHFALNLTLFNRLPLHPQIMDVAGDFTVVSLLEVSSQHHDSFEDKARLIQKQLWKDMDNRQFSGVNFIRELARIRGDEGKALMPVVFSSTIGVESSKSSNLTDFNMERLGTLKYGITQTPQVCLDHQVIEYEGKLLCIWDAVEELFPKGLLDDMFDAYIKTLNKLVHDEKAWNELSSELISVKPPEHFAMELETDTDISTEMLHTLFEKQASLQPEKEAIVTSAERITYGELKNCSDEIGRILRKESALPNTLVAVVMEKGWEQIAGALGVLKSGAAYLPVSPNIPSDRLEYLLNDGRVDLVLTQPWLEKKIKWPDNLKIFPVDTLKADDSDVSPFEPVQQPDDLAYVIYTSGSTGTPKGVMIDHIGAVNTILDVNRKFSVNTDDCVFSLAAMDFDLSVYDIFGTLAAGGTIVIPEQQGINDPAHWTELMTRECITVWNSVPQVMQMLTEHLAGRKEKVSQSLRLVLMSGDWIPLKLPETIKSLFQNVDVYSLGGATEASIWSIYYPIKKIDPDWKSIPYGRSMTNQKFYVFDESLQHCPDWVTGNLYIGGVGLAKGYWRDEDKTSTSFIEHPRTGERIYKTGDLGRYLPDGNIEFQGREDFQVKIRGYRIELGEIEATIKRHPAVIDTVVSVTGNQREDNRLIAYVVPNLKADSVLIKTEQADPVDSEDLWALIKTAAQLETEKDFKDSSLHSISIFHEYMEKTSVEYICHALNDLGFFIHPNEKLSLPEIMQKGKIHERFRSLVGQWLDILVKESVLKEENNHTYTNLNDLAGAQKDDSIPSEIKQSSQLAEGARRLNSYLQRVRKHFKNLLQGEIDPLEFFFSEDNLISPEQLTQLMPGTDLINNLARKILKEISDAGSSKKPVRILEIGARTGETSATLIPFLSADKTIYTCSDVSSYFTNKTRDRFTDCSFVRSSILDIEQNPQTQGYEPHSFDIIVASNSLHRVRNVGKSLKYITDLLTPGGLLLIMEGTVNNNFQKISVGFIEEGFTAFEDERAKSNLPLLSTGKWQEALGSAGFEKLFSPLKNKSEVFGQDIIIAQASSIVKRFSPTKLRDFLKEKLPKHMIPSDYILMDAIPLTPNGKIDRKALPIPDKADTSTENIFAAPETDTEILLAGVWYEVLQLDQISINGNFFDLGGDSLLATRIIAKVREAFDLDLSLRILFESPTIKELSNRILTLSKEQSLDDDLKPSLPQIIPEPDKINTPYPLSDVQQAYLIGRSGIYELGNVAAHCYFEFDSIDLDIDRANSAWQRLIEHHAMLRTIIQKNGQSQQILPEVPFYKIKIFDFNGTSLEKCELELEKIRYEMSHQVILTDQWPLFDIKASLYDNKRVRIHVSFENIIFDGWSMFHLLNEWSKLYKEPEAPLPALELSFRDYILAVENLKESEFYKQDQEYWINRLQDLPIAPELPLIHNPEPGEHYRFSRFESKLESTIWERLKNRTKQAGLTPSGLLLAAYAEVISTWCNSSRFTINLTMFNRPPLHPQINNIVGDFTSLTLLAINNSSANSFTERAQNLQQQLWQDLDHPYFSGIETLREFSKMKDDRREATMPIVFTSALGLDQSDEDAIGNNNIGEFIYGISQTPQVLVDHQVLETSGQLMLIWDTVKELFPEGLLDDMFDSYCRLLYKLAEDDKAWNEEILVSIPEDQFKMRNMVNATERDLPTGMLHTLFEEKAIQQPEKEAIVTSKLKMSYGELSVYSECIGRLLRKEGATPNTLVAIVMEKGWEQVVSALGVLKSGAAYLPIDSDTPPERLKHILRDGEVRIVLTQSWLEKEFEWPDNINLFSVDTIEPDNNHTDKLEPIQQPEDLAYVIYTSGSTGRPKGVMIDHRGAVNTITDVNQRFDVGPDDRVLALSALNFDLSVYDLFGTLAAGGVIILPEATGLKDPAHWLNLMKEENVTIWNSVPALMEMFVKYASERTEVVSQSLRLVLLSGDWIPLDLSEKIKALVDGVQVISLGGATEASIWSILYPIRELDSDRKSIPYGQPMSNQTFYVLNEKMDNCPDWVTGNLYIGGIGLAKGYWADEEKTRIAFVEHPQTGERLYATGDKGRYLPEGNIEFMGRDDFQVKIRGYRIELGEIEAALKLCPGVSDAVVQVVQDTQKNNRLLGYVVSDSSSIKNASSIEPEINVDDINDFLKNELPDYMVPSSYIFLEFMPLNPNGKIDRKGLPVPEDEILRPEKESAMPETSHEQAVYEIWKKVLKREHFDISDNFFEIGGDSLNAVELANEFFNHFKVEISLPDLFGSPTISGMADAVIAVLDEGKHDNDLDVSLPQIVPATDQCNIPFPLTDVQQAYWLGRSNAYELGNVATHTYFEIENDNMNIDSLCLAWQKVIERHEMLRAIILPDGQQMNLDKVPPYQFKITDLRGESHEVVNAHLESIRLKMEHQMIPVETWPLFEIQITRYNEAMIRMHLSFDALILDGWSMGVIFRDWYQYYLDAETSLTKLELSYRDYVLADIAFRESDLYKRDENYALSQLPNLPASPELPLTKSLSSCDAPRFKRLSYTFEKSIWQKLKNHASQNNLTPSGVLVAAYAKILGSWSKKAEFTINLSFFNRIPLHPQVNDIVGDFTSMKLLPITNQGAESFQNWAEQIQQQLWSELDHRYFSGVRMLRELARHRGNTQSAIMPVVFTSFLGLEQNDKEESAITLMGKMIYNVSQTPQVILDNQVGEFNGALSISWDVVEELFPGHLLEDMFEAYCDLLRRLANEEESWQEGAVRLLPATQIEKREKINETDVPRSSEILQTLFTKQVLKNRQKIAVIDSRRSLNYGEVSAHANHIGNLLRDNGVRPNELVAIVMEKGWEQVVAVLGVLISGAAYLPISSDIPRERLKHLLKDGRVDMVLIQSWIEKTIEWPDNIKLFSVDAIKPDTSDDKPLESVQRPDDLAYVIYTSGSTGLPKGVMIDHRGAVNTILDVNKRFGVGSEDKVLALSSLNFDLSVFDVFGTLAAGGTIVFPKPKHTKDPSHWLELIHREKITVWNSVPALMRMLVEFASGKDLKIPETLRLVLLSGDWLPVDLPGQIKNLVNDVQIISLGGATEASIWSILYPINKINPEWKSIPYGRPMANQQFYVLNESFEDCPDWVPGNLYIGGLGLAKGYWRDEEKTNSSFIIHPETAQRLYRTGDLGRYFPDGNIEFIGREDFQVKINGYRVELGEIETIIKKHPDISDAVVIAVGDADKEKSLAGYAVPAQEKDVSIEALRMFLKDNLTEYMIPNALMILDQLPRTPNGKVDRKALPLHGKTNLMTETPYVAPQNELEHTIALIMQEVIGIEKASTYEKFFNMGANSLDIVRMQNKLVNTLKQDITVLDLFEHSTISDLAKHITRGKDQKRSDRQARKRVDTRKKAIRKRKKRKL